MARHSIDAKTGDYVVDVCQFTFRFRSLDDIQQALEFYRQKLHPTSRLPTPEWAATEARQDPTRYRRLIARLIGAHHYEYQRWYERVPLRLQKESKRQRVVKALERALNDFGR